MIREKEQRKREEEEQKSMPGGMPGGMPQGLQEALNDPEIAAALQNPKIMNILQDIMSNPGNITKYMSDPDFMNVYTKLMAKMQPNAGM